MEFKYAKNAGCLKKEGCCKSSSQKLSVHDWLSDLPETKLVTDFVEIQFKNTRKGYYRNSQNVELYKGDIVAVESTPGHDIGTVTLTGQLVTLQMRKYNIKTDNAEIKRIYRIAKPSDLEKYEEAKGREQPTMLRARQIAEDLRLNMKIGDVEFQGDGGKAIFYYIADERVDFRQLIKLFAEEFKIRIEMKQIGARQEAGRIGGIGPCGRELCCSGWMSSFSSVSTGAARYQDISMNPQKLAGQCAKLKCCFNFEVDTYVEAQKKLPSREVVLETTKDQYFLFKADVLKGEVCYSTQKGYPSNLVTITAKQALDIIQMNKKGIRPEQLTVVEEVKNERDYFDGVGDESLTRFDKPKTKQRGEQRGEQRRGPAQKKGTPRPAANAPERNTTIKQETDASRPEKSVNHKPQTSQPRQDRSTTPKSQTSQPRPEKATVTKPQETTVVGTTPEEGNKEGGNKENRNRNNKRRYRKNPNKPNEAQ